MLIALKLAFRIAMLLGGGLLVYTAVTMFPDEEGILQNRIENLWVAIDDKQKSAVGRATVLFNRIASYVTRIYNRILGVRLVSVQMVGVSSASSIAGFFLFGAILLLGLLYLSLSRNATVTPKFNVALLVIGLLCLVLGSFVLIFAILPSLIRNWLGRTLSLLPLLFFLYGSYLVITRQPEASRTNQITLLVGLLLGIVSDFTVLAAVRFSVRLIATSARLREIVFAFLVQVGAFLLIAVLPFELSTPLIEANKDSLGAKVLLSLIGFNLFTVLGVLGFLLLLAIVLLHRVFWPLLGRVVYSVARFKPLQNNRKTFALIGLMCGLYGLGLLSGHGLFVWFVKRFAP
jgi:hypothetical protein